MTSLQLSSATLAPFLLGCPLTVGRLASPQFREER
jgi:hypothetical protein